MTSSESPVALPISARAIGEFTDIFPLCALASGPPTIRHTLFSSVSSSINLTVAPNLIVWPDSFDTSITSGRASLSSSSTIRASFISWSAWAGGTQNSQPSWNRRQSLPASAERDVVARPPCVGAAHLEEPSNPRRSWEIWSSVLVAQSRQIHGEAFEISERTVRQGRLVRGSQDHTGRLVCFECLLPAGRAQAPTGDRSA